MHTGNGLNIDVQIDLLFIQSVIWFGLFAAVLRYFQSVVFIGRQYKYLHQLEEQINQEYKGPAFTREGMSYLKNYPLILSWADYLYTLFFPLFLVLLTITKVYSEFQVYGFESKLCLLNGLICLLILISTVLYVIVLHFKKE